jgi:hypothetical protein
LGNGGWTPAPMPFVYEVERPNWRGVMHKKHPLYERELHTEIMRASRNPFVLCLGVPIAAMFVALLAIRQEFGSVRGEAAGILARVEYKIKQKKTDDMVERESEEIVREAQAIAGEIRGVAKEITGEVNQLREELSGLALQAQKTNEELGGRINAVEYLVEKLAENGKLTGEDEKAARLIRERPLVNCREGGECK